MQNSHLNTTWTLFYQKVGKLFYAVAMADGAVHSKEVDKLKALVRNKWLALDDTEDEHGSDAAFQIEIVFDWLLENEKTSTACLNDFTDFYKQHEGFFSDKIKTLILKTAHEIAYSFSDKNKSELILLGKLQLLFKDTTSD